MKSVIDYVGTICKATVKHHYRYARVAFTYRTYIIDDWFPYMTGVKVSYLRQSWTKSQFVYPVCLVAWTVCLRIYLNILSGCKDYLPGNFVITK